MFLQNFALPNAQYLVINFFGVFRVTITAKPMKRKDRTAEKAAADPKRFSGDGSALPRLSVWFSALFVFVACACRGGASAPSLSYQRQAHATVANGFFEGQFE